MCIVAQTKSRSDAQLNHSPNSLSSQQRRQQATIYLIFDKLAFLSLKVFIQVVKDFEEVEFKQFIAWEF